MLAVSNYYYLRQGGYISAFVHQWTIFRGVLFRFYTISVKFWKIKTTGCSTK